jgi:DNA repair exonuclease SbcCD ATPase subunit
VSRRAEAFRQLAGHLDEDTAAAAAALERRTAELQRLEAAVADKAVVLHRLNDTLTAKLQEPLQLQGLPGGDGCAAADGGHCDAAHAVGACKEQLAAVQHQQAQAQRELAAADVALIDKRAAVAEAEEQLAAAKRDLAVCDPRLAALRQQMQELELSARAQEAERQVGGGGALFLG